MCVSCVCWSPFLVRSYRVGAFCSPGFIYWCVQFVSIIRVSGLECQPFKC
jgi:hypothetical protein